MNDYEKLDYLIEKYNLMLEKKTREEYAVDKFKKRYNFKPNKPGSKIGTITVNGKEYDIDIDHRKSVLNRDNTLEPRSTSISSKSGEIALDDTFFKNIKNQKRRDAILNHEIGHVRLHSSKSDIKLSPADHAKSAVATMTNASKSKPNKSPHFNNREVEADLYASIASGKNNLKKGLQDSYKSKTTRDHNAKTMVTAGNILDKQTGNPNKDVNYKNRNRRRKTIKAKINRGERFGSPGYEQMKNFSKAELNSENMDDYLSRIRALKHPSLKKITKIRESINKERN